MSEHTASSGGFLDSIISGVADFANSVISIPRRTAETVGTLLFEPGSPGVAVAEGVVGVVDIFNPDNIVRDLGTIAAPVTQTRVNPETGRAETVQVEPGILGRIVNSTGEFIRNAVRSAGEAIAPILPATSTIIIVLGLIAIITIAIAVPVVTATT